MSGFNLVAWCVEVAGDCVTLVLRSSNFLLAMNLATLLMAGVTPVIYLLGAQAGGLILSSKQTCNP